MNHACEDQDGNVTAAPDPPGVHRTWEVVLIALVTGPLSFVTILGNLLVLVSFRVNPRLRTIGNYFLLSLAVADLILGAVSMNLYTAYIIKGRWTFGDLACDLWLALDYVASNASVMNLLVISFDRYFSVTRPLTYRARRTPGRAAALIALAWVVSFVLWAPAILFWPRVGSEDVCSIPFVSEASLTCGTAIAAFYLPVSIMAVLYWRIYWEIENRAGGLSKFAGSESGARGDPRKPNSARSSLSSTAERGSRKGPKPERRTSLGCFPSRPKQLASGPGVSSALAPEGEPGGRETGSGSSSASEDVQDREAASESNPVIIKFDDFPVSSEYQPAFPGRPSRNREPKPCRQLLTRRRLNTVVREKKAARILSAILLAFVLTWTPYNVMVLASISYCVPEKLWQLGYWLCYVNSTVNPVCYALCNETFRATFRTLMLCRRGDAERRRASVRADKACSAV